MIVLARRKTDRTNRNYAVRIDQKFVGFKPVTNLCFAQPLKLNPIRS